MAKRKEDPQQTDLGQDLRGFDMASTIDWYTQNSEALLTRLPQAVITEPYFAIGEGQGYVSLTTGEIAALVNLFPANALKRSRLKLGTIVGGPTRYFKKGSTAENPLDTENIEEAIGATYIIPSFTKNVSEDWSSTVALYQIPDYVSPSVRKLIHAQGLIHEVAHTLLTPLYRRADFLRLPDGIVVNGREYILEFAHAVSAHSPFSHYSSAGKDKDPNLSNKRAIEEEFAEAVTGYLLGFVHTQEQRRQLDPFVDRPEVRQLIGAFLNAEVVINPS